MASKFPEGNRCEYMRQYMAKRRRKIKEQKNKEQLVESDLDEDLKDHLLQQAGFSNATDDDNNNNSEPEYIHNEKHDLDKNNGSAPDGSNSKTKNKDDFDSEDEFLVDRIEAIEREYQLLDGDDFDEGDLDCPGYWNNVEESLASALLPPDHTGTLWYDLRTAMDRTRMTTVQTDAILQVLHKHKGDFSHFNLPKTHSTLMRTQRDVVRHNIRTVSGHQYYNFGLENQLKFVLALFPISLVSGLDVLIINWNNDGLPIYKSRKLSAWPILAYVANLKPRVIFEVILTVGEGKPKDLNYLEEFVDEFANLVANGLQFNNKTYKVSGGACICDAPARAQVKNTRSFQARYGCGQCEMRGFHDGKRMIWVGSKFFKPRTDDEFRLKAQPEHHLPEGETPLLRLNMDMIADYPPDFMHQVGGTVKKLLMWLIQGPKKAGNAKVPCKLSARNILILDKRIMYVKQFIPSCFARKLRVTVDLPMYKFTELRLFILYVGKILMLDLMQTKEHYLHLVTYNVVCSLMVDEDNAQLYPELQQKLMEVVVDGFVELYGAAFMTYNAHANLHFPAVAARHGSVDSVSAYPFENHLGQLKSYVTSSHNALIAMVKGVHRHQSVLQGRVLTVPQINVNVKPPNNIYINHRCHRCFEALNVLDENKVQLREFTNIRPFFTHPIESYRIGCYKVYVSTWRYVHLSMNDFQQLRRGIRINLDEMPQGRLCDRNYAVFMAVHHSQHHCLF